MSEQTPHQPDKSGNRWETTGTPADETAADETAADEPAAYEAVADEPAADEPGGSPATEAPARTSRFPRVRAVGVGAAAAVLLVGAVGGFAVGRATAGDDREGPGDHQVDFQRDGGEFPGDRPGLGDDLDGDRPGFGEDRDGGVPGFSDEDYGEGDRAGSNT